MKNTDLKNLNIVYIAENIFDKGIIDERNRGLEQESSENTSLFLNTLNQIFRKVYYYDSPEQFSANLMKHKDDLIFPNWYGKASRSRVAMVPAICEANNMKYIGPSSYVNFLGNDKYLSKLYVESLGIKTAKSIILHKPIINFDFKIFENLKYPVIVKPNYEGSSIGISDKNLCSTKEDAIEKAKELFFYFDDLILIEEYIEGEEVEVFVFGNKDEIKILESFQNIIRGQNFFKNEILDVYSKFVTEDYEEVVYPNLDPNLKKTIEKIFMSFDKIEFVRFDFRINNEGAFLLELSSDCGIGPSTIPAKSFAKNNYDFKDMLTQFSYNALSSYSE
ncbi:D-alanine--D-alanine ligase family protein [Fusibacter bizertensis]